MNQSIKLESFKEQTFTGFRLPIFTVYERPSDFPNEYIVRLFDLEKPTVYYVTANTKEEAIAKIPDGLSPIPLNKNDDPVIVAVFI